MNWREWLDLYFKTVGRMNITVENMVMTYPHEEDVERCAANLLRAALDFGEAVHFASLRSEAKQKSGK